MSHSRFFALALAAAVLTATAAAAAEEPSRPPFETESVFSAGMPLGLAFLKTKEDTSARPFVMFMAERFRLPRYTPFGVELGYAPPGSFMGLIFIDAYQTENFRLRIFDVGLTYTASHRGGTYPITVTRFNRNWDLTFGAGAEIKVTKKDWMTIDYRVFMPDPVMIETDYAALGRPYIDESLKGGLLCIGFAHPW